MAIFRPIVFAFLAVMSSVSLAVEISSVCTLEDQEAEREMLHRELGWLKVSYSVDQGESFCFSKADEETVDRIRQILFFDSTRSGESKYVGYRKSIRANASSRISIGTLSFPYCKVSGVDTNNSWARRKPPYIGYARGEPMMAGGDGTCILGFPKEDVVDAAILINKAVVHLRRVSTKKNSELYLSSDKKTSVQLKITGSDSTCEPGADKCCGTYTYGIVTVSRGKKSAMVRVVNYDGS